MDDLEKKLLNGPAYKLFYDECQTHIQASLEAFANSRVPDEEELRLLSTRAHTIKGGSGFFKFTEIASISGQLEKLFAPGILNEEQLATAKELLQRLESNIKSLNPPKTT